MTSDWLQLFEYRRMVAILLQMVTLEDQEEFVQRIGVYLLNSLACQVDGTEKKLVGDMGGILVQNAPCVITFISLTMNIIGKLN